MGSHTSGKVKEQREEPSFSDKAPALGRSQKESNLKRKYHIKKEVKNIFELISIINKAEHKDYSFFTAENVIVYKKGAKWSTVEGC